MRVLARAVVSGRDFRFGWGGVVFGFFGRGEVFFMGVCRVFGFRVGVATLLRVECVRVRRQVDGNVAFFCGRSFVLC